MPQQTETVNELFVLNANSGVQPVVDIKHWKIPFIMPQRIIL